LQVGDVLQVSEEDQGSASKQGSLPPQAIENVGQAIRFANAYVSQVENRNLSNNVVAVLEDSSIPKSTPIINIHKIEPDIDNSGASKFTIGFTRVTKKQSQEDCWNELFCEDTLDSTKERIMNLNSHLNNPVRTGEIIILTTGEPESDDEHAELDTIMTDVTLASKELVKLTDEQEKLHDTYFEVLVAKLVEYMDAGLPRDGFAIMGAGVGSIADGMARHLQNVADNVSKLDALYISHMGKNINKKGFLAQRKPLMEVLNKSLDNLTKKVLSIPADLKLKKSLGLSTKSLIHNANEILEQGSVDKLGAVVANTAKWLNRMEILGNIAIGLNVLSGVYNVATSKDCIGLESCGRESAKQTGGVIGGYAGGLALGYVAGSVLASLSIASAPAVLIVVGGGALLGGIIGAGAGQDLGNELYEVMGLDEFLTDVENKIIEDIPQEIEQYITDERFRGFSIPRAFQ